MRPPRPSIARLVSPTMTRSAPSFSNAADVERGSGSTSALTAVRRVAGFAIQCTGRHAHPGHDQFAGLCRNSPTLAVIPMRTQNGVNRSVSPHDDHGTPGLVGFLAGNWSSLQVTNGKGHQGSELPARSAAAVKGSAQTGGLA